MYFHRCLEGPINFESEQDVFDFIYDLKESAIIGFFTSQHDRGFFCIFGLHLFFFWVCCSFLFNLSDIEYNLFLQSAEPLRGHYTIAYFTSDANLEKYGVLNVVYCWTGVILLFHEIFCTMQCRFKVISRPTIGVFRNFDLPTFYKVLFYFFLVPIYFTDPTSPFYSFFATRVSLEKMSPKN